jgi:plastocyanin
MRRLRLAFFGALTLLIVPGVLTHTSAYGSSERLTTKQVLATESSGQYTFAPKSVKVKVGTQVRWKNTSDAAHTVTATSKNWSLNKQLGTGKTVALTFKKPGTYKYYCSIHPYMKGTIVVTK